MKAYTKNRLLLLFLIFIASIPFTSVYATYFRYIGVKDGLPQLSVLSIHQDVLGRIWLGTMQGLSIYDGREMITLKGGDERFDTSIKNNSILNIVEDAHHNIFLKAGFAFIYYQFYQDQFQCIRVEGVNSIAAIRGKVYASVQDSIFVWDEEQNDLQFFMKTGIPHVTIRHIFQDRNDIWWISTSKGLYKYVKGQWICVIPDPFAEMVYENRYGTLWAASRNSGLYRIDSNGTIKQFVHEPGNSHSICGNDVRTVTEDRQGNLWIGTRKGLTKYSPESNQFETYTENDLPGSLRHSSVFSLLLDKDGDLWVGTYYGGVSTFTPNHDLFRYYPSDSKRKDCLDFPFVGDMVEDKRHNLWICTDGGGLNFMDREAQIFKSFDTNHTNLKSDNLKSICYDSINDKLYIGLYQAGLYSYDIHKNQFTSYLDENRKEYAHHTVSQVNMYDGKLIFQSEQGIFIFNPQTGIITPFFESNGCIAFLIDSKEYLWVLRSGSITRIHMHQPKERKRFYLKEIGTGLYNPLCIHESKEGTIYIGTEGSGVLEYEPRTETFSIYKTSNSGLLDDYCYNIATSQQGFVLFLGSKGLSFFDPKTKKIEYVAIGKKFPVSAFNDGNGLLVAANGDIFFGSTEGLIMLSEEGVRSSDQEKRSLYFSKLFINNTQVTPGDQTQVLSQIIGHTKEVILSHDQNNLAFTFANNDFGNSVSPALYEYKLEGFDKEWIATNGQQLIYTNMNPGKYVLKVRERNVYGNLSNREIQLAIVIRQPFYNTFWAWFIYVVSAAAILYIILSGWHRQQRLKASLENEKQEKKHIEEINRFKLDFFTNISHELRTPLTLIITQAEIMLRSKEIAKSLYESIGKLYKHASQMRNLISELLDFYKLEQAQMCLKVRQHDIVSFLKDIYLSFEERATTLNIEYTFDPSPASISCCFDTEQLRKVFFNLLSNAFKFTPKGGKIEVSLSEEEDEIVVRIIDNGIGIEKQDIDRIFERYYQSPNQSNHFSSGIGLALCKDIVTLHHGKITVESKFNYGSIFTVRLKKGTEHFVNDPRTDTFCSDNLSMDSNSLPDAGFMELLQKPVKEMSEDDGENNRYTILIVEDNKELLSLLCDIFLPLYRVSTATDGKTGLQKAIDEQPNIILSDVMMPEMDGDEMCLKIKNNLKTCHIPVLLLTARTAPEQHIEGLLTGADDYITKPFNAKILLAKVNAILRNRELLLGSFRKQPESSLELLAGNELDQKLLKKIEGIVEAHIEDPEFDVDQLAQLTGMGRSSFFEKLKALTGMTPANFILVFRLRKAAALLLNHPEFQMNDIASQVGFGSGRYFSRCFKNHFNVTPQQYREQSIR